MRIFGTPTHNPRHVVHRFQWFIIAWIVTCLVSRTAVEGWSMFGTSSEEDDVVADDKTTTQDVESVMVSPILNREIQTSVVAHDWPTSPQNILCEAYAYFAPTSNGPDDEQENTNNDDKDNMAGQFLERLAQLILETKPMITSYSDAIDLALAASKLDRTQRNLLQYSLALRANSPYCEVHRGLARESLKQSNNLLRVMSSMENDSNSVVAVLYPHRKVLVVTEDTIGTTLQPALMEPTPLNSTVTPIRDLLIPDEFVFGYDDTIGSPSNFVILYGNLGTMAFARTFQYLKNHQPPIPFIVRHLGDVFYEEKRQLMTPVGNSKNGPDHSVVVLQGYGVRLDIRNVEYKVFDDRSEGSADHKDDGLVNLTSTYSSMAANEEHSSTSELQTPDHQFLGGVNVSAIMDSFSDSAKGPLELEHALWNIHDQHQVHSQIIPPVWQRRRLALQAAAAIVSSKDPLVTLQEISQNLPSVASTLVHLKIPTEIHEMATATEEYEGKFGSGLLYLNGRAFNVDRPSFNMFELLQVIREERDILDSMKKTLGPYLRTANGDLSIAALKEIHKAWVMGDEFLDNFDVATDLQDGTLDDSDDGRKEPAATSYRIDVGRGWKKAVLYLNDIEKDSQYSQWSRSVKQALMTMQFGMPPSVRRNLFTILAALDPLQDSTNLGFSLASQLMQSSYPARLGILIFSEDDVDACARWVAENGLDGPCPVPPIIADKKATLEDLRNIPVSTQAVHRLISRVMRQYASFQGIGLSYVEYLGTAIENNKKDSFSLFDLIREHGTLVEALRLDSEDEAIDEALEFLKESDGGDTGDNDLSTYGMTVRFAVDKGLKPGMSFLNGLPLPSREEDASDLNRIFGEEQQFIFGQIVRGEITDYTPKSVYAAVLTGDRVFKRFHPLLAQGSGPGTHIQVAVESNAEAFFSSKSSSFYAEANFVIDAYFAFDTDEGLQLASKLVSTLDVFPSSIDDSTTGETSIGMTYRILPSTPSAAASGICQLFAHASNFSSDIHTFLSVLQEFSKLRSEASLTDQKELLAAAMKGIGPDLKSKILNGHDCSGASFPKIAKPNVVLANGRVFPVDGSALAKDDIELLLTMELRRAKAVTKLLKGHVEFQQPSDMEGFARASSFLAVSEATATSKRAYVFDIIDQLDARAATQKNPLHFSWNTESDNSIELTLEIIIFLNPITEVAQRVSPILRVIRDQLELPIHVVLAPPTEIDGDAKIPITSYYRLVADPKALPDISIPKAIFSFLPSNHVLTIRVDVPEPWNIQQTASVQDTDNLLCDIKTGCSDDVHGTKKGKDDPAIHKQTHITKVEYGLKNLLIFGQCYDTKGSPPNGLQLTLARKTDLHLHSGSGSDAEIGIDGTISFQDGAYDDSSHEGEYSDTLVMKTVGYWQLRANPGVWKLSIAKNTKASEIFELTDGFVNGGKIFERKDSTSPMSTKSLFMKDFVSHGELLLVKRRPGFETASLFHSETDKQIGGNSSDEVIHVFSLATGHLYERFLKIMMLSVTKRTSSKVKFWLFENYLSPSFKSSTKAMAERIGCEVEYVTYKWPEWLRGQTEKQRIIWGYKILFLDVLFPLDVKKIIYVDADQVVRGDLKELWDLDLKGAPYGYTPFCTSRHSTLGYQFWRDGFWKNHLRGKPYHISALYVVDLERFRRTLVGDQLRAIYQQLSADPHSLSNLDQDLPNYAQHQVPIFSLPQEWLWCESWCSDETKSSAKTIDLCNNPEHKEPKVSMAKRIISGNLFNESWVDLDAEVEGYERDYLLSFSA